MSRLFSKQLSGFFLLFSLLCSGKSGFLFQPGLFFCCSLCFCLQAFNFFCPVFFCFSEFLRSKKLFLLLSICLIYPMCSAAS